jgi:hypothetical protein
MAALNNNYEVKKSEPSTEFPFMWLRNFWSAEHKTNLHSSLTFRGVRFQGPLRKAEIRE